MGIARLGCIAVVTIAGLIAGCGKSTSEAGAGANASSSSNSSKTPIRLVKFYVAQLGRNGNADVMVFENTSSRPVDAFKGQLVIRDKFGEVADTLDIEYTDPVAANSKIYIHRIFIDDRLVEKKGNPTAEKLEAMAKEVGAPVEKLEVAQKYEFKLVKAVEGH